MLARNLSINHTDDVKFYRAEQNEDKFILKSAHWRRSSSTGLRLNKQGAPWLVVVGWLEQKQTSQHQHPQLMAPWLRPQNHRRQVIIELSVLAKLSPITVLSGFPPGFVIVAHTQSPNQDHLRRVSFFAVPSAGPADKSPIWFREPDRRTIRQRRARIKVEKSKQIEEDPLERGRLVIIVVWFPAWDRCDHHHYCHSATCVMWTHLTSYRSPAHPTWSYLDPPESTLTHLNLPWTSRFPCCVLFIFVMEHNKWKSKYR